MAGMPEMQEQFPAMARDGRYAGPQVLPASAGTSHFPVGRKCRSNFRRWPWMAGMLCSAPVPYPSAMRIALGIEYDGTDFPGWQRQIHTTAIQTVVEEALGFVADH